MQVSEEDSVFGNLWPSPNEDEIAYHNRIFNEEMYDKARDIYTGYRYNLITLDQRNRLLQRLDKASYSKTQQGRDKLYGRAKLQERLEEFDRQAIDQGIYDPSSSYVLSGHKDIYKTFSSPAEASSEFWCEFTESVRPPKIHELQDLRNTLQLRDPVKRLEKSYNPYDDY